MNFAKSSCQLSPGAKILDIGTGWGCAVEYLGNQGISVDAITISEHSARFVSHIIESNKLSNCNVFKIDFFDYLKGRSLYICNLFSCWNPFNN